jgi:hypothetical protein
MRSSMVRRVSTAATAAGLISLGLTLVPAVASAAPATGSAALCVDSGADYSAALQWPNRGGLETTAVLPGKCSSWGPDDAGQAIVILANKNGALFNLGNFTGDGSTQIAYAHGAVGAGTENFTVTNY